MCVTEKSLIQRDAVIQNINTLKIDILNLFEGKKVVYVPLIIVYLEQDLWL